MANIEEVKRFPRPANDYQVGWNNALGAYWDKGLTNIRPSMAELADAYLRSEFMRGWKDAMRAIRRW